MRRIWALLVLFVQISNNSGENVSSQQLTPENVISKTDFEKTLLKTADGIYGMLNSDKSRSLVIDEVAELLDSVTNHVLKRYGHNPPVDSAVLRRVLENLTYLVADASTLNHLHRNEEKSISFPPVGIQSAVHNGAIADEEKQKQIDNMMTNFGKPEALTPIYSKFGHVGSPVSAARNPSDSQTLLVLNSRYMPVGIAETQSNEEKTAKTENVTTTIAPETKAPLPNSNPLRPYELLKETKIFDDKIMSPGAPALPWDSAAMKTTKTSEPSTMSETDALKLTPSILFIDNNGKEFQLVGAGGQSESANCHPSKCMLTDENSKQVLAFQKPLSMEYLVLRGGNGEQLYTSGVQLCQDSDAPPSHNYFEPTDLTNLLPHLRRRNSKKSALLRKLASKWDGNNLNKRREANALQDEDVANLFKWHDHSDAKAVEGRNGVIKSGSSSLSARQAYKALRKQRRDLRRIRRRFPNRRRKLDHGMIADEAIKGYDSMDRDIKDEDNNKRIKRSRLSDVSDQGEIFDLMPETKPGNHDRGHLSNYVEGEPESIAPQDLIDLDNKIDQMEQNTTETKAATPSARAADEEINMVQPNTPYAIEEELLLKNASEKRRGTDMPIAEVVDSAHNLEEPDYYDYIDVEVDDYDTLRDSSSTGMTGDSDALPDQTLISLEEENEGQLTPAEIVERVEDDVLLQVRNSNAMEQVLGNSIKPAPVLYNPMEQTHHKEYENVMRNLLMKVLMDVERLAKEDIMDQNCLTLDQPLKDYLAELLGLPETSNVVGGFVSNIAVAKRSLNPWA